MRHGRRDAVAERVGQSDQADKAEIEAARRDRPIRAMGHGFGNAEHADATRRHALHGVMRYRAVRCRKAAQVKNGFGRAFGCDEAIFFQFVGGARQLPDVGHRQQVGAQAIGMPEPDGIAAGGGRFRRLQRMDGDFHRVDGINVAGARTGPDDGVEMFG